MSVLYGATCIVGIIFMLTFMFVGIWLFITALKAFQQLRYKNYILEKIYQKLDIISKKGDLSSSDIMNTNKACENLFDLNNDDKLSNLTEIKKFDSTNEM